MSDEKERRRFSLRSVIETASRHLRSGPTEHRRAAEVRTACPTCGEPASVGGMRNPCLNRWLNDLPIDPWHRAND